MITSYFIDNEGTLHTFIGEQKHITFSNVDSIFQAEMLIEEENRELLLQSFNDAINWDRLPKEQKESK